MPGPFYMAWAGGGVAEQVAIVTTGNTHGGEVREVTLIGDIEEGRQQVLNVISTTLSAGKLYLLEGDGITPGTIFIYDNNGPLTDPPDSLNLNVPATLSATRVTFRATEAVLLIAGHGPVSQDSSFIELLDGNDLLEGIYGISSEAIGYTWKPGSGESETVPVPSAWFVYHGDSPVSIWQFASTPVTTTGGTTYEVNPQGVFATKSGFFPIQITGFANAEWSSGGIPWFRVTGIPAAALAGLTPGLRYNIAGNGIPVGTTFVAPAIGITDIDLDQAASSAETGALLTITGPRAANTPFDPNVHNRFDEDVLGIAIEHSEGDFAALTIDIKNQGVGLLAAGRDLWCWLSWDRAWTPQGGAAPDLVPLFNGRLVGIPKLAAGEVVQLQFIARPDDYNQQKVALANAMRVLPFWDPVWVSEQAGNPDTVLETYSALWHIDRTSLDVTTSDVIEGEDGIVTIAEDQAFYDAFSMSFGDGAPLRQVTMSGTVSWEQTGEGYIDVTGPLFSAFGAAGNYQTLFTRISTTRWHGYMTGGGVVYTFNGTSVKSSWPQPGTNIGGGWEVAPGVADDGKPYSFMLDASLPIGWLRPYSFNVSYIGPPPVDINDPSSFPTEQTDFTAFINHGTWTWSFALNAYHIRMVLRYQANRKRTETVRAVLVADIMDVFDNAGTDSSEEISYSSDKVAEAIDPGGGIPIGDPAARTYLQSDRGAGSFEYLMLAARAKLRARARSAEITFGVDFPTAIAISLRHSVALFDRRIPGGSAIGKVKSYRLVVGEDGMYGEFTIGCTIGNGNPAAAAIGIPAYVEDGYVEPGYQMVAGSQYMFLTDELAYQTLDQFEVRDDGLNLQHLTVDQVVKSCTVTNGLTVQLDALNKFQNVSLPMAGLSDPYDATKKLTTTITLEMVSVTGSEYHTDFLPAVSMLAIPQTIDLRAPPSGA